MRQIAIERQWYLPAVVLLATLGVVGGLCYLGAQWRAEASVLQARAERERIILAAYEARVAARRPAERQEPVAPEEFHVQLLGREDLAEEDSGREYRLLGRYTDLIELLAAWEGGPPLRKIDIISMRGQGDSFCLLRVRMHTATVPLTSKGDGE